jgi:NADH-quinone oxidoreductase subunit K
MTLSIEHALVMGGILFAAGLVGFLTRRNLILLFLSIELMLTGVSLNFIAFGLHHGNYQGQFFAILILTIAASEAALALSLVVALNRYRNSLDVNLWRDISEQPTKVKSAATELGPADDEIPMQFPTLTPAGLDPLTKQLPATYAEDKVSDPA